jgi:hypothetical protein
VLPIKEEPTNDFMTPPDDLESLVENQEELIQVEETPKDFSMETLMLVKEFLGPKDMLSFTSTCKELHDSLTYCEVIRTCMLSGGYELETMNILKECCEHASIFPMTPNDLLGAALKRRCEICKVAPIHHVRKYSFLPICFNCMKISGSVDKLSKEEELFWSNPLPGMAILHNKRVYAKWYGKRNARSHWIPQMREAQKLGLTHYTHNPVLNDTDDHRDTFFYQRSSQVLKILDKDAYINVNHWTNAKGNRIGPIFTSEMLRGAMEEMKKYPFLKVDDVLEEAAYLEGAPAEGHEFYSTCIELFNEFEDEAILRDENKIAQRGMRNDRYTSKRVKTCQRMVEKILHQMDKPHMAYLLSHRINKNYQNEYLRKSYKQQPLKFSVYWVDSYMRANEIMKAPSKICIKKVVREIEELHKQKTSKTDCARLRENYKTLLKYYYKTVDGKKAIYRCHGV